MKVTQSSKCEPTEKTAEEVAANLNMKHRNSNRKKDPKRQHSAHSPINSLTGSEERSNQLNNERAYQFTRSTISTS